MQPPIWTPSVALSPIEQQIVKRIKRAKLFIFLRQYRHMLFDDAFQQQLAAMYKHAPKASRPSRRLSLPWRPLCKPTPACPMTN